ncbi:helix-turn-helix domain-containing protein [Mammaliicoccus sciuri]|uniref:Helix-turn-helix domain-containing protein n=1 Tax=Mammaliicoccus sciuri TaxID=1296 RepID=A0AAW5LII9_MAMSC|nr:helix-turn-helix transcriptional regulator [Mammaliicoccus sciuri]MCQ9305065.1 helix-turn-helix domain-containing protein [Mammaliicoccus sciuri]
MKTFKDSLRDELHNQNISVNELANMTGIKEQKLTYYIKNISYNSLSLHEILIISNVLGKSIYDMCQLKDIKNITQI